MNIKMVVGNSSLKKFAQELEGMIDLEAKQSKMLNWSAESLAISIENGNSILAFDGDEVVGHICLFSWSVYVEICALIVRNDKRKHGLGTRLIKEAVKLSRKMTKKQVILLPNETSYLIGKRIGFSEKSKQYFSQEIWESCSKCPEKKNFPNCHCRPMIFDGDGEAGIVLLNGDDEQLIRKTAELYCGIWKEPPWNEDFWKVPDVISDMKDQMKKDSSIFLVAQSEKNVAGFTWGYNVEQNEMRAICGGNVLDHIFSSHSSIFYIDELATAFSFRRKGIGAHLTQALIGEARTLGNGVFCLRTDIKAQAARTLYEMLGFRDLGIQDEKYPNRTYWLLK